MKIGFIGLGLMGRPMSLRLLGAGRRLSVYNRDAAKTVPLAEAGARVAASPAELAAAVDVLLLCVSDTAAVESVVFGAGGVAESARPDQLLVDFSSIDPAATRDFAGRLARCGLRWVDAPVSGGVPGAAAGKLAIMAGGAVEDVDALREPLAPLYARLTHMGPVGSGQVSKICNQMIVGCNALAIAEMMALAEASGVDAARLPEALAGGFADSKPLQILAPRMAAGDFEPPQWTVATLLKDLDLAAALAGELDRATPLAAAARQVMRLYALREGGAGHDPSALVELYRRRD